MLKAIPCTVMRGGTSKGLYFDAADLPADPAVRDRVLLAAMGSPDTRQIDGMGGAHSLTSKVAVLSRSAHPDADVDYLFLQVVVDRAEVSDSQNCGNILAGVGPWAIEAGWVPVAGDVTPVRIHMVNSKSFATALVPTPDGHVTYEAVRASMAYRGPPRRFRWSFSTWPAPPAARCCQRGGCAIRSMGST
nr:PrpF domain-containing protein [Elstera litoralis]